MRKIKIVSFFALVLIISSCSKCYECEKSTSSSSSTIGACFDTSGEARDWKRDMEGNGYDCRIVPEP